MVLRSSGRGAVPLSTRDARYAPNSWGGTIPTYRYFCQNCGEYELWESIHGTARQFCAHCDGTVKRVYSAPATYGVGRRGERTREVDAKESTLSKDLSAYKRLRREGHQPRGIDGADRLESTAVSRWHVETGQPHPDHRVEEAREAAKEIMRHA